MTSRTSWLLAAAMLAGTSIYAQEKEPVKFTPPVIKKDSSPSAKPGKTPASKTGQQVQPPPPLVKKEEPAYKIKVADLKPETRAKIERDGSYKNLTAEEKEEVRRAVKPPLKAGDRPPPPPPALPKKKS
jgi:hypothetical protein